MKAYSSSTKYPAVRYQRGVTLIIALIILIAMTLAGLAMFRQIGTGVIVARNLTFREAATSAADQGVEAAVAWLHNQDSGTLQQAVKAQGYYAAWCNVSLDASNHPDANNDGNVDDCGTSPPPSTFTAAGYNWFNAVHLTSPDGTTAIDYVIHRLCRIPGDINASGQDCTTVFSQQAGGTHGWVGPGKQPLPNLMQPYFRITTRVTGPMNTVAYTQTIVF